jgi:tetraacyldisaccharide 4'-kinase
LSWLLAPLGWGWAAGAARRQRRGRPQPASIPVVCIGNLTVGGAGKTPVALSVARRLRGAHFLSTGYGGSAIGPVKVDAHRDSYERVGDEPLLLAEIAPCWVAKDRLAGAHAAEKAGASCIVMDDGYQDPTLRKDVSLVVVDGHVGFGNGRCMPAGPLRESIAAGLRRATAVVMLGEDKRGALAYCEGLPVLYATLEPELEAAALDGQRVVAFAGIARPQKFFQTLEALGAKVVEAYAFDDHHPYHRVEIGELKAEAEKRGAALITTTKDIVRVPFHLRESIGVLRMTVTWHDEMALFKILGRAIPGAGS